MKLNRAWRVRLAQILCGAALVLPLLVTRGIHAGNEPVHLVTDWSHRHLVFSPPRNLMQQFQLSGDPRYVQQWVRRNAERKGGEGWRWRHAPEVPDTFQGDWSINIGSGATVGADSFPAKYSFDVSNATCSDFVVYNTGLAGVTGAGGQATIVAFNNLYVGASGLCGAGPGPSTYWAYNTGTGDLAVTSPTFSIDGSQVAFVQSTSGGTATLVLLRWKASSGTLSNPVAPTAVTAANYYNSGAGCTVPCMTTITFNTTGAGTHTDTHSSPYYDYASDTLFVGDDIGYTHKFTPVFKGAPVEITATWPVHTATAPLSSPIYDPASGKVFVTSSYTGATGSNGGRIHGITAAGVVTASGTLGPAQTSGQNDCHSPGTSGGSLNLFVDAPILDSTNNTLYVFVGNDGNGNAAVVELPTNFGSQACGNNGTTAAEVTLGTGSTAGVPIYTGNFDNLYYTGSAGHLYVCGNSGGNATLYQVAAPANGVLAAGAATAGPVLTSAAVACSPVTENFSASVDYIFLSVTNSAVTGGSINCGTATGCLMSFIVTSSAPTSTAAHASEAGGTSGIIVDGSSTATGASQVYFTPLSNQSCTTSGTTGGCAIQASQAALQ